MIGSGLLALFITMGSADFNESTVLLVLSFCINAIISTLENF
jgi:hypothetical protein